MKGSNIILVSVFLFLTSIKCHIHPHGRQIQFINSIDGIDSFNYAGLKEILLHPEVKDRNVMILSIIGAYRRGKSFFLDYCLRYLYANYNSINMKNFTKKENWFGEPDEPLTGFSWAHGSTAHTKGILIWSDVFLHENDGKKIAIILIDTQGLFELDADSNLDAKIFGITSFISSVEIFNLNGVIQENQLEYLKMVTDFSKVTLDRQNENSFSEISKPFQQILMLVRDWYDDDIGYGEEGGAKYLNKNVFNAKASRNKNAQSVRVSIKESFDKIYAFLLPHPGKKVLKTGFDGRWSLLDEDFKKYLKSVIELLLAPDKLVVKKLFGKELTGKDVANFAHTLFTAFQSSELPEMKSLFNIIVEDEMNKLTEYLFEKYKMELDKALNYNQDDFYNALYSDHQKIQIKIINELDATAKMAKRNMISEYKSKLIEKIYNYFNFWKDDKIKNYEIQQNNLLKKEIQEIKSLVKMQTEEFEIRDRERQEIRTILKKQTEEIKSKDWDLQEIKTLIEMQTEKFKKGDRDRQEIRTLLKNQSEEIKSKDWDLQEIKTLIEMQTEKFKKGDRDLQEINTLIEKQTGEYKKVLNLLELEVKLRYLQRVHRERLRMRKEDNDYW